MTTILFSPCVFRSFLSLCQLLILQFEDALLQENAPKRFHVMWLENESQQSHKASTLHVTESERGSNMVRHTQSTPINHDQCGIYMNIFPKTYCKLYFRCIETRENLSPTNANPPEIRCNFKEMLTTASLQEGLLLFGRSSSSFKNFHDKSFSLAVLPEVYG